MTRAVSTMATQPNRSAVERHCDLMRQGFMRCEPAPALTAAQIQAGKEYASRILAKLDATASSFGRWSA